MTVDYSYKIAQMKIVQGTRLRRLHNVFFYLD